MQTFSLINCIMEISIQGSIVNLQYIFLLLLPNAVIWENENEIANVICSEVSHVEKEKHPVISPTCRS